MTSFVHVDQPSSHPGVRRVGAVVDQLRAVRRQVDGARGLSALLLAAIVSAVLVVADRMIANVEQGEILVAWAALWAVAFVAIALCANSVSALSVRAVSSIKKGAERRAAARADAQFMAYAQFDPRVMHELQAAVSRQEKAVEAVAQPVVAKKRPSILNDVPSMYEATRRMRMAGYY